MDHHGVTLIGSMDLNGNSITDGGAFITMTGAATQLRSGTSGTSGQQLLLESGAGTTGGGGTLTIRSGDAQAAGGNIFIDLGIDTVDESNNGALIMISTGSTIAPAMHFREAGNNGSSAVILKAPDSMAASQTWILPDTGETTSQVLGVDLGEFTVAGLPAASSYPNCWALATDASGGRTIVRSDGTNWKVVVVEGATVTT